MSLITNVASASTATTLSSTSIQFRPIPTDITWQSGNDLLSTLEPAIESHSLSLYGDACGSPDLPGFVAHNCSATCANVEQAFGSPSAFANCLSYPSVTHALAGPAAAQRDELESQWGIVSNDTAGARSVVSSIQSCLRGYIESLPECQDDAKVGCPLSGSYESCNIFFAANEIFDRVPQQTYGEVHGVLSHAYYCLLQVCTRAATTAYVDLDIAGIGVCFLSSRRKN